MLQFVATVSKVVELLAGRKRLLGGERNE